MIAAQHPPATTPKPGIYKDVPFQEYLRWEAISNSGINMARKSLRHFKERVIMEPTKALRLGQFLHCGVLEPLLIAMRYVVMPQFENDPENKTASGERSISKTTKYYKLKAHDFAEVNKGKEIVDEVDYKKLLGINRSLLQSANAREYLTDPGDTEVSILWIDDETKLPCKARIDMLNTGINDLKSSADAMAFSKSIANFGYHRQAAHYQAGVAALTGELKPFRLIAVETSAPFPVRAAPLSEDALSVGAAEVRTKLREIAEAYASSKWPCYGDPSEWHLPSWYDGSGGEEIELSVGGESVSI